MILLFIFIIALIIYTYTKNKYFTLHGPLPGLSPHFLFGNLIQSGALFNKNLSHPQILSNFKKRYGDLFQFWIGPWRLIVVNSIGDVQHIFSHRNIYDQGDLFVQQISVFYSDGLICTRGAKYKRHATFILPLFRRSKITSHFDVITSCTDKLIAQWQLCPPSTVHRDIIQQCQNLLLAIFGFIAFDYDLETLDCNGTIKTNELTQALHDLLNTFQVILYLPRLPAMIYSKLSYRYRRAQKTIAKYCHQMIEQELVQSPESILQRKRTSLIASLVASLQKDEILEASKPEDERKGLSRKELLDEMLFFLIAGFETTSTALAWFIHLMSKHPEVQRKLKAEMKAINERCDLTLTEIDSLIYLECVIKEVLRFCPPIVGTCRTLLVDDRLPESGAQLFKGDQVFIPFHNLSHDHRYWSIDPELFYPERFLNEDRDYPAFALIPFSGGHRQCIGQDLARFELKIIITRLMQYITFGDGGVEFNQGGHLSRITIMPKSIGVTIEFETS